MQPDKQTSSPSHARPLSPDSAPPAASAIGTDSIFHVLVEDHRTVAGVFEKLKAALQTGLSEPRQCMELFSKIDALLTPHALAEERLVYPAFVAGGTDKKMILEGIEEHGRVHLLLAQLRTHHQVDETWALKAQEMMKLVEHHVLEEENEVLPAARKTVSQEEGAGLASEFLKCKQLIAKEKGLPPADSLELPPPATGQPSKA